MFVFSRSFYLLLNEKVSEGWCVLSSIRAVLKQDFQDVHPKNLLA